MKKFSEKGRYTHYGTSALVAINLAAKQGQTFEGLSIAEESVFQFNAMPSVAGVRIQLTCPRGDLDGWKAGIRRIWQQLRTANSGRINYNVYDVEKYVLNVRALHAIHAFLKRAYRLTYSFRSTNGTIPTSLLEACGLQADSILANAADLFMYVQRFGEMVRVNFPLNIPLFDRTEQLFESVFLDSSSEKPAFYVPTMEQGFEHDGERYDGLIYYAYGGNGDNWYEGQTWTRDPDVTDSTRLWNYTYLIAQCEQIKNDLLGSTVMAIMAADIIKAFGDKSFSGFEKVGIDEEMQAYSTDEFSAQLQNAHVLYAGAAGGMNDINLKESNLEYSETPDSNNATSWVIGNVLLDADNMSTGNSNTYKDGIFDDDVASLLVSRYNNPLLTWMKNTIDPNECISITRWMPSNASIYRNGGQVYIAFSTWGTEIVTGVFAIQQTAATRYGELERRLHTPIAGLLPFIESGNYQASVVSTTTMLWANFDWAPRFALGEYKAGGSTSPDVLADIGCETLDWDVFAEVGVDQLITYFSYGNQSLLYAGESQNQSNRKVYEKGTNNKNMNGKRDKRNDGANRDKELKPDTK